MNGAQLAMVVIALVLTVLVGILAVADQALRVITPERAAGALDEGRRGAGSLLIISRDPAPFLNTILLVRIICEISSVVLVTLVVSDFFGADWVRLVITVAAMVVVSFIAWGVAPRTLGRQHAGRIARAVAAPVRVITAILGPLPKLMIMIGNALTPGRGYSDGPFVNEDELRQLLDIARSSEVIEAGEQEMIHSVFELGDTVVREVMVPRPDMVWIEQHKTLRQAVSLALRSGYSRIPVIGDGGVDDVVGIVYLKDLVREVFNAAAAQGRPVAEIARPATFVPESKHVDALLREMQATRTHIVIAVDEYGGTAGLATIEDILEEIVGEIVDEYDIGEVAPITRLDDGRVRVTMRLGLDELDSEFGVHTDADEDVETVGGLMGKELGKVPLAGSVVRVAGLELEAEQPTGRRNRVHTVLVRRLTDAELEDADAEAAVD
ncbi:hemolysin family protein [Naumannella cuiyingiana]|uniref:CBS domain containing-hemolysin-like protein n=1 Tax=Naumannella cuiyingiana TaxID=1347891 RepID=A0A7Z0IJZ4_9ACTN|nr:hemolysin family protein [Naumannella cuiyingiana]NYI69966.1 CBS domain containing-hemolysin-like protein [Naumannella cuiyingiana]